MKRVLAIVLALTLLMMCAGCGSKENADAPERTLYPAARQPVPPKNPSNSKCGHSSTPTVALLP